MSNRKNQDLIIRRMLQGDRNLSSYACLSINAIRFTEENIELRGTFFRDIDRIIHSLYYTRYVDKTQVFSFNDNENISKRMTHVSQVAKIARTIGRALGLNEDLIEGAALGHDLGHTPYGHVGENILNKLSLKYSGRYFNHNVHSVRVLMAIDGCGNGKNICLQTLDAIMCHNGEFLKRKLGFISKTKDTFLKEYEKTYTYKNFVKSLIPMTLEGVVVRVSDMIAYLGRDIEDAIRLGIITSSDIPLEIRKVLGSSNKEIINTIVNDIIWQSLDKPYIEMSEVVYNAMVDLKKFNYQNIYYKANSEYDLKNIEKMFAFLFTTYMSHLENNQKDEDIWTMFLSEMNEKYLKETSNVQKVIDFIAGMTDNFFKNEYHKYSNKKR